MVFFGLRDNVLYLNEHKTVLSPEEFFIDTGDEKAKKALKLLSKKGACEILFKLETGPKRFSQLMFEVKLNPGILSRHLKALMELEIVSKNSEMYELTESGKKLIPILRQLLEKLS